MREAGQQVELKTYGEMSHNDPLIALASPWRKSQTIRDEIADFAKKLAPRRSPSVPVQRDLR